ncbi:uncharacterized protein LOC130196339 [Pseudoliparis swirei]|uniref:uncharacterized protein LOC130196339 n=1 Tax=Pseudoliparis swirei TaxID=2059687 RepID=UPI0024BF069E|nr:uncharacterized protein LOC130196339 [Pseudoliparis swirei]
MRKKKKKKKQRAAEARTPTASRGGPCSRGSRPDQGGPPEALGCKCGASAAPSSRGPAPGGWPAGGRHTAERGEGRGRRPEEDQRPGPGPGADQKVEERLLWANPENQSGKQQGLRQPPAARGGRLAALIPRTPRFRNSICICPRRSAMKRRRRRRKPTAETSPSRCEFFGARRPSASSGPRLTSPTSHLVSALLNSIWTVAPTTGPRSDVRGKICSQAMRTTECIMPDHWGHRGQEGGATTLS